MILRDVIEFNRLSYEQVLYLSEFDKEFKVSSVEPICLTGKAALLAELNVYDDKKMYIGLEIDLNNTIQFFDETNTAFVVGYLKNRMSYVESFTGNLTDELTSNQVTHNDNIYTIRNIHFSKLNPVSSVIKFIGLRITLV